MVVAVLGGVGGGGAVVVVGETVFGATVVVGANVVVAPRVGTEVVDAIEVAGEPEPHPATANPTPATINTSACRLQRNTE